MVGIIVFEKGGKEILNTDLEKQGPLIGFLSMSE